MYTKQKIPFQNMNAYIQNEAKRQIMADAIAHHMTYIYTIVMYDKMGVSWRKIDNIFTKVYGLKLRWRDDNDKDVTNESLFRYAAKKKIDALGFVKSIPANEKIFLADVKRGNVAKCGGFDSIESGFLSTLLLMIPVLKEHARWSNAKIEEFFQWVAYGVKMYSTKLPRERGYVYSDEYIRWCIIEDEKYDIKKGEKVA